MARHPLVWLDVFTHTPLEGNGLAVVLDADGVEDDVMLRFARETGLSETTFVQTATEPGADYRNRIWTVVEEMPFAGHPSLGTAVAVARARREREVTYVQQTHAGLQPVEVRSEGERVHASVLQEPAVFGPELDPAAVMATVGLEEADADPGLAPQIVSTGLTTFIAPVRGDALARATPDFDAINALLAPHGTANLYLVACDPGDGKARARMFTGLATEGEDPATGSAAGPLCAYLAQRTGAERVDVAQGVEMGRPSRLVATMEDGRVRVGGGVVCVLEGTVSLP